MSLGEMGHLTENKKKLPCVESQVIGPFEPLPKKREAEGEDEEEEEKEVEENDKIKPAE